MAHIVIAPERLRGTRLIRSKDVLFHLVVASYVEQTPKEKKKKKI